MAMQTHAAKRDGEKLPPRYRLMMFQKPIGPWRPTIADAKADAIRAGTADYDHDRRGVFVIRPSGIEKRADDHAFFWSTYLVTQDICSIIQRQGAKSDHSIGV